MIKTRETDQKFDEEMNEEKKAHTDTYGYKGWKWTKVKIGWHQLNWPMRTFFTHTHTEQMNQWTHRKRDWLSGSNPFSLSYNFFLCCLSPSLFFTLDQIEWPIAKTDQTINLSFFRSLALSLSSFFFKFKLRSSSLACIHPILSLFFSKAIKTEKKKWENNQMLSCSG